MKQNTQNNHILRIASFLAMTLCTLVSCEKEIEFNGEQIDPKLVINSLVEPEQPVKAYISKSLFFLDNEGTTQAPADLVATLYVNGNRIGEMIPTIDTISEGYEYVDIDSVKPVYKTVSVFANDYRPVEGDVIKITASANGFDDVDGTASPLPKSISWSLKSYEIIEWENLNNEWYDYDDGDSIVSFSGKLELTVEITDPNPGQTDYFRILLEAGGATDYEEGSSYYVSTSYDDPVFGASVSGNEYIDISDFQSRPTGVFTDQLFDGRTYQLKLPVYLYVTIMGNTPAEFFQVPITLEHMGKEYYNYLFTCEQTSQIMQLFSEPVQTYSNVNNGYGVVASRNIDSLWFALPLSE